MHLTSRPAQFLRLLAAIASSLLLLAAAASGWFYWRTSKSLPQVDGAAMVAGLAGPVTAERDALGVPTVRAGSRTDVARALGWLHAQDRFFQMDLMRRSAAGELAELFGPRAVPRDRAVRLHGFRQLARTVATRLAANERAVLEAYVAGVNVGLAALAERPFEYLVLREQPLPWLAEDTILVIYALTLDLQDGEGRHEHSLMTLRDQLGLEALAFFAPTITPDDAALDGTTLSSAPIPGPKSINLRTAKVGAAAGSQQRNAFPFPPSDPAMAAGSNAFALAGKHTASGGAMVANDMHLRLGVPNTWYRASLEYPGQKITGVTLPGVPVMVAGSNGRLAWGFTASYVDTGDLVVVEVNSIAPTLYKAPGHEELLAIERRKETIRVKGAAPVVADYEWTIWGPIVGTNDRKRPLAHHWVAHDPDATNLSLLEMEEATRVADGVAVARRAGLPAVNLMLADRTGAIAWTVAGRLPKRIGYDGRLPVTWSFGDRKWDGYLAPAEVPVVTSDPRGMPAAALAKDGRLWSANHRQIGGDALARIGDGGFCAPARAAQIRDALTPLEKARPADLLAVQLDTRALFLTPWHRLLLDTLTPAATAGKRQREELRSFAERWEGRADTASVSYRIVREFRTAVQRRVFEPIFASCTEAYPDFDWQRLPLEGALRALLRERPLHLLSPTFASWDELLVAAVDDTIKTIDRSGKALAENSWGWRNRARIQHPFSSTFPWIAHWLDMPADPLPGDNDMPRVQSPTFGASERFVVSPGRESEGIFHMPGGQSGHPLSPYYRAGHQAWVRGEPTPFLPGKTEHTVTLRP